MSLPSGFKAWSEARGISPFHPDSWAPADREAFMAWKQQCVAARAQARIDDGTWALMDEGTRATWLRDDETMVTAPPPSRVWERCACHVFSPVRTDRTEPTHGLAFIESFRAKVTA